MDLNFKFLIFLVTLMIDDAMFRSRKLAKKDDHKGMQTEINKIYTIWKTYRAKSLNFKNSPIPKCRQNVDIREKKK